jgi:hypothetical protein
VLGLFESQISRILKKKANKHPYLKQDSDFDPSVSAAENHFPKNVFVKFQGNE